MNLAERRGNRLLIDQIDALRLAFEYAKQRRPFRIDAVVVLPDHLHCIWTPPADDTDFSTRRNLLKGHFSHSMGNRRHATFFQFLGVSIMAYPATTQPMSAQEFLDWEEKQVEKHEFIHGEIFAMVGVTRRHATVAGNVFRFLGNQLAGSRCRVYMADMKLKLVAADAFFYPDVFVTCAEADHQAERLSSVI